MGPYTAFRVDPQELDSWYRPSQRLSYWKGTGCLPFGVHAGSRRLPDHAAPGVRVRLARLATRNGISRFYVVDVEADGRLGGPPLAFIARLRTALGDAIAEVHAGGGVRDLVDIRDLAASGVRGVVVGRALQESRFTIAEAQRVADDA